MMDEEMWAILGSAKVMFWICPVEGHSDSRPNNEQTVVWERNVARCTWPGCDRTSAKGDK